MNTSGEEHPTDGSETADNGKVIQGDGTTIHYLDLSKEQPTERAILKFELMPESAERILSMVEREQTYEKKAYRTESRARIARFLVLVTVVLATIVGVIVIGLNSKSAQQWIAIATSFIAGAALVVTYRARKESKHLDDEMPASRDRDKR